MTMNTETRAVQTAATAQQPAPDLRRVQWSRPAVDVLERDDALILALDAPGVAPDRFEISLEQRALTVSGVRTDGLRGWRRVFAVPTSIDVDGIGARAENGVLYVTLPKAEAARPRRIEVS